MSSTQPTKMSLPVLINHAVTPKYQMLSRLAVLYFQTAKLNNILLPSIGDFRGEHSFKARWVFCFEGFLFFLTVRINWLWAEKNYFMPQEEHKKVGFAQERYELEIHQPMFSIKFYRQGLVFIAEFPCLGSFQGAGELLNMHGILYQGSSLTAGFWLHFRQVPPRLVISL